MMHGPYTKVYAAPFHRPCTLRQPIKAEAGKGVGRFRYTWDPNRGDRRISATSPDHKAMQPAGECDIRTGQEAFPVERCTARNRHRRLLVRKWDFAQQ